MNASWRIPEVGAALRGPGVELVAEQPEPYGTAGTLKALEPRLGPRVLVHNCDLVTDLRPEALLATHERSGASGTVAVVEVEARADLLHEGSRARRFVDRRREDLPGASYIGMAVLERAAIARLSETRPLGLGETLLRELAAAGDLSVHVHAGYRADVGTPAAYLQASLDVLEGRAPAPQDEVPGRIADVEGGRAYLGPGASAAPGTLGPGAIVLGGATVDEGARVERAIVWRDVTVSTGRRVIGSIALQGRDLV